MKKQSHHDEFVDYIREILEPFGISKIRAMFGGFGIYKNGIIFALIADHELYFKANDRAAVFFQSFGSEPFSYEAKGRQIKMSYWRVLPEILEDQDILKKWHDMAYSAALTSKKKII